MTATNEFDRVVADWLAGMGTIEMPAASVDAALGSARRQRQRRGLWAALVGAGAWPIARRDVRVPRLTIRTVLIAALLLALAAALLFGVGNGLRPASTDGGGGWITVAGPAIGMHVLSPSGSSDRALSRDFQYCPNLTPDGNTLIYSVRFEDLYAEPLDGTGRSTLGRFNTFGYANGVWAPDRTHLAFRQSSDDGLTHRFQVLSILDGSVTTLFVPTTFELVGEAWSPDGQRIAIAQAADGQARIDIVDLTGDVQASIGPFATEMILGMAWSPDGSRLAYLGGSASDFTNSLQVVDLASSARRELASRSLGPWLPTASPWSPDGKWIAVVDADGHLQVISTDGTTRTTLPMAVDPGSEAKWSPVEDRIAAGSPGSLAIVRPDGTERVDLPVVARPGGWAFGWSPDGSRIVIADQADAAGDVRVRSHDSRGDAVPMPIATYGPPGGPLCLRWDPAQALD